jgi:rubredoxin
MKERMIDCSMCGHAFTREEGSACSAGCPMARGCGMVTCPSCGFEFPPESKLLTLVTNLIRGKGRRPAEGAAE